MASLVREFNARTFTPAEASGVWLAGTGEFWLKCAQPPAYEEYRSEQERNNEVRATVSVEQFCSLSQHFGHDDTGVHTSFRNQSRKRGSEKSATVDYRPT